MFQVMHFKTYFNFNDETIAPRVNVCLYYYMLIDKFVKLTEDQLNQIKVLVDYFDKIISKHIYVLKRRFQQNNKLNQVV